MHRADRNSFHLTAPVAPPLPWAKCVWAYHPPSARVMHVLSQHLRRNERYAALGNVKTLAILLLIDADAQAGRQPTVLVDYRTLEHDIAPDVDIGQDDGLFDRAVAVDVHVGEE